MLNRSTGYGKHLVLFNCDADMSKDRISGTVSSLQPNTAKPPLSSPSFTTSKVRRSNQLAAMNDETFPINTIKHELDLRRMSIRLCFFFERAKPRTEREREGIQVLSPMWAWGQVQLWKSNEVMTWL